MNEPEPTTINRLNALMGAGYEIDTVTSQKVVDAIWLDHPAEKRVKEKTLIIYNSGLVVGDSTKNSDNNQLRLYPEESEEFKKFVNSIPQPTLWERSQKAISWVIAWGIWITIITVLLLIVNFVINYFTE